MNFKQILRGLIASVLAVIVASKTASGIYYDSAVSLGVAIVLLGIFNIFLKPLLMLFSLPFILLTLGLGIWIINALLFLLVGAMVDGFYVESFSSALWGAFVLSVINLIATIYFGDAQERKFTVKVNRYGQSGRTFHPDAFVQKDKTSRHSRVTSKDDDVIDI